MNFLSLFTQRELMIMGLILGSLILIILILIISEKFGNKENVDILEEDDTSLEKPVEKIETENIKIEKIETENIKIEKIETENIIETKKEEVEEIKQEVKPLEINELAVKQDEIEELIIDDEPIIKKIESPEVLSIEPVEKAKLELLKAEEEIVNQPSLEDTLTNLETIEEENAIISYQELLENTNELTTVLEDDGDEPITLDEVFKLFNGSTDSGVIVNEALDALPIEEAYQGEFNSTPYLSPVNGLENESLAEIQLENTANLEKLDKEIRKTNQFLNILNELKKNLE